MTEGPEPVASQGGERTDRTLLRLDRPIQSEDEDLFGWSNLAKRLADRIGELDLSDGAVVGIDGPWGSGKTSLMNLLRSELRARGFTPLDFNAWAFQDAQDVSRAFMIEIAAQIGLRSNVAQNLRKLADCMSMMKGTLVLDLAGTAGQILGKALDNHDILNQSVRELRNTIAENLGSQTAPRYAIFIDDVDRLQKAEILNLFKAIRVVCNFPGTVYVIAYDYDYLANTLGDAHEGGVNYVDKIVQLAFDVPILSEAWMKSLLLCSIAEIYPDLREFNRSVLQNAVERYVIPATRTPRQVCRYLYSLKHAVSYRRGLFDRSVHILMELIRTCDNRLYRALGDYLDVLVPDLHEPDNGDGETQVSSDQGEAMSKKFLELCKLSGISEEWAADILIALFPSCRKYTGLQRRAKDIVLCAGVTRGFANRRELLSYLAHHMFS